MRSFADKSGLSRAYISLLEKNNRPGSNKPIVPSLNTIKKAAKGMSLDFNELFNMLDSDQLVRLEDEEDLPSEEKRHKGVKIPVLGKVAAGIPIEAIEDIIDEEEIAEELALQGNYFGLRIDGDSMEPDIHKHDTVIVRQQSDVDSGDIAIVLVNGHDATCKRIRKYKDGIELIANNPSYEPKFYSDELIKNLPVTVIGKVIELRRKF